MDAHAQHDPPAASLLTGDESRPAPARIALLALTRWRTAGVLWPVLALAVALIASAVWLCYNARGIYFYSDDWDFLLQRGTVPHTQTDFFGPHNGHWSTGVVVANLLLFAMFGLHTYWPWVVVLLGLHVLTCFALYVVLRRCDVAPWPAVAVVALLVGSGQSGALVQASAMNHVASILAGVLALHALLTWSRYAGIARAWVWLIVALACSNVGLTVTLCAVLFALLQRGWRAAIQVAVVPALAFAGWYVGWGRSAPDGSAVSVDHPGRIAGFVWSGLTTPLSFGHHWTGVVLAVLLALVSLVSNVWGRGGSGALRRLAVAGWLAATAQLVLIALTPRLGFGDQTAGEGRYGYVTLVLVLPSVALALGLVPRRATSGGLRAVVVVAVVALICAWTVSGIPDTRQYADAQRLVSRGGPARLVALSAAVDVGERVLTPGAADPFDSWFRADLATSPGIRPDLPQGTVDPQRRVEVEAEFMTAVSTSDQHLLFHTTVTGLGFTRGIKAGAGCGRYVARGRGASLVVPSLNGVEIGFRGPATSVTTQIIRDGLGGSRTWPVTPGVSYFVATSAQVATLVITLNHAGQYHVCTG